MGSNPWDIYLRTHHFYVVFSVVTLWKNHPELPSSFTTRTRITMDAIIHVFDLVYSCSGCQTLRPNTAILSKTVVQKPPNVVVKLLKNRPIGLVSTYVYMVGVIGHSLWYALHFQGSMYDAYSSYVHSTVDELIGRGRYKMKNRSDGVGQIFFSRFFFSTKKKEKKMKVWLLRNQMRT